MSPRGGRMMEDLTGRRFGRLTVLRATDKRYNNMVVWDCLCDCGKLTEATTHALMSGAKRSCGCLRKTGGMDQKPGRTCEICGREFAPNTATQKMTSPSYLITGSKCFGYSRMPLASRFFLYSTPLLWILCAQQALMRCTCYASKKYLRKILQKLLTRKKLHDII